jgi:OCT family organic cation transporter-like MFS transporter 4/5
MPLVVMGVVSVVGGLVSLRLPETLGAALPTTIQEGEEFGKEFGWRECMGCGPASRGLR